MLRAVLHPLLLAAWCRPSCAPVLRAVAEVLPAAQMAANAMAASGSSWGAPNWLDARPAAFRSTQTRLVGPLAGKGGKECVEERQVRGQL